MDTLYQTANIVADYLLGYRSVIDFENTLQTYRSANTSFRSFIAWGVH